jgi:hypothetical protein
MTKLKGNKKDGYVITVTDKHGWRGDLPVTYKELKEIKRLVNRAIK